MDLREFCGKRVKIDLTTGHYYAGFVLNATQEDITIRDLKGNRITIKSQNILLIREVSNNG